MGRVERVLTAHAAERKRVTDLLSRDEADRRAEADRLKAEREIAEGRFANIAAATLGPTPEQLAGGRFEPVMVERKSGTVRAVRTVRRVMPDRLLQLYNRAVLDDDTLAACLWYRRTWEDADLRAAPSVGRLEPTIRGTPARDHLPRTEQGWEARKLIRFAWEGLPTDVRGIFEAVVLHEMSVDEAARVARCRYANAAAAFRRGALALHGRIAHLLPISGAERALNEGLDNAEVTTDA